MVKKGLKAKSMEVSEVRPIVLKKIGVDSILLDQAVPEIFYFEHDVGVSPIVLLIGNPDVNNNGSAILVLF